MKCGSVVQQVYAPNSCLLSLPYTGLDILLVTIIGVGLVLLGALLVTLTKKLT